MKIAIIGAGFGALAAAYDLSKSGQNEIELIEANEVVGGLSASFKEPNWEWSFEEHYHHAFDTDKQLKNFLEDLGLREQLVYKRAKSSTLYNGQIYQIDSPLSLLKFKEISLFSRLRTGAVLAFLKILPNGVILEKFKASRFLKLTMGQQAWEVIWEPLFTSKFGRFRDEVNLSWFWARVNPRTAALGYFNGGFGHLAEVIQQKLEDKGVKFTLATKVTTIKKNGEFFILDLLDKNNLKTTKQYDLVISTLASPIFARVIDLPELKKDHLVGLGAMTLLLRLKKKLLKDGTYWLNVNEKNWPFVAIVEHDNYISNIHYDGESLVYIGRYLETSEKDYQKNASQLLADYKPFIEKIDPNFMDNLIDFRLAKAPFAQPISFVDQSRFLPKFNTSIKKLYWVCMQHIYPFDRGINHAVAAGRKLAAHVRIENSDNL